jgi:hypothetical protein
MKKGNFVINHDRWEKSDMETTTDEMYDCADCIKSNTPYNIIRIPGPLSTGNVACAKGVPTTKRRCTGCGAEDGPWVPVP